MLVETPGESRVARGPQTEGVELNSTFEASLNDLALAHVFAFEHVVGGWRKRAADLAIVITAAPFWLAAGLVVGLHAKWRSAEPVLSARRCVGYCGRPFDIVRLRLAPPLAEIVPLRPRQDARDEPARLSWRDLGERLPQMANVLRGEMSLIGPLPMTRGEVDALKGAKHYLSARPGVFGIVGYEAVPEDARARGYAMGWTFMSDLRMLRDAVRGLIGGAAS
jgi:exopolysaccharide production protein ExoY